MTAKRRKWVPKQGHRVNKRQAQLIGETLDALGEAGKPQTAEEFWKIARNPRSKQHKLLKATDWNRDRAAVEWQLHCCRRLIGAVELVTANLHSVKGWHAIEFEESEREYRSHEIVIEDDDMIHQRSEELYADVVAAVKTAVDLKMDKKDGAWRAISRVASRSRPVL